jgi:hypothetical protein
VLDVLVEDERLALVDELLHGHVEELVERVNLLRHERLLDEERGDDSPAVGRGGGGSAWSSARQTCAHVPVLLGDVLGLKVLLFSPHLLVLVVVHAGGRGARRVAMQLTVSPAVVPSSSAVFPSTG